MNFGLTTKEAAAAKRVLVGSVKLLQTKGWCQGVSRSSKGHYCASEAINSQLKRSKSIQPRMDARLCLEEAIKKHKFHVSHIVAWNDKRGRTKAQVLKVFRTAIQLAAKDAKA